MTTPQKTTADTGTIKDTGLTTTMPDTQTPKTTRAVNPYSIRKAKTTNKQRITNITTFLNIAANYVDILLRHDATLQNEPWYELWQSWLEEGILEDANLHMVSVTVDYPNNLPKTNKSVTDFILEKIYPLQRFMLVPGNTRENDPWLHLTRPIIMRNTPKKATELDNHKFELNMKKPSNSDSDGCNNPNSPPPPSDDDNKLTEKFNLSQSDNKNSKNDISTPPIPIATDVNTETPKVVQPNNVGDTNDTPHSNTVVQPPPNAATSVSSDITAHATMPSKIPGKAPVPPDKNPYDILEIDYSIDGSMTRKTV